VTHAYSNAHLNHRSNMDAQHKQTIYRLECVTSRAIVLVIDMKLYKFNMIKKIIIIYCNMT